MNTPFILENATVVTGAGAFRGFVAVTPPYIDIVGHGAPDPALKARYPESTDLKGKYLMAGVIDDQVHFREPGLTHKADIASESLAAAAGGVTSFMDMPNTTPPTLDSGALRAKHEIAAATSAVNYSFFIGAGRDNIDELRNTDFSIVPGVKLFLGSSTGNMAVEDEATLDNIFSLPAIVAVHSEDNDVIARNIEAWRGKWGAEVPVWAHPLIRSRRACVSSTRRSVERARRLGTRLHVLHVSTADELAFFIAGEPGSKQITCEVCVHHLWFTDADYPRLGTRIKWNPAVKTPYDRAALLDAVRAGIVDVVATDHAPHLVSEKAGDSLTAASGAPIVQFSLSMMLDLSARGFFPLPTVAAMMSERPAALFGIEGRGRLEPGYFADLAVVEPDVPHTVRSAEILSKCGWSPLEGTTLRHRVAATYVNGVMVYDGRTALRVDGAARALSYRQSPS